MKSLYESILDKTNKKVGAAKKNTNIFPPTLNDWKRKRKVYYIDYQCEMLINDYIYLVPDELFNNHRVNTQHLTKSDITTIRVVLDTRKTDEMCRVYLCNEDTLLDEGVFCEKLGAVFMSGINLEKIQRDVVEYFNRVFNDWELLKRTFEYLYYNRSNPIWNVK